MRHIIVSYVYFSSNLQLPIFGVTFYVLHWRLAKPTVDGRNYTDITSKLEQENYVNIALTDSLPFNTAAVLNIIM